eukprot:6178414-Pleurochrysis_carterae.AAC.6
MIVMVGRYSAECFKYEALTFGTTRPLNEQFQSAVHCVVYRFWRSPGTNGNNRGHRERHFMYSLLRPHRQAVYLSLLR